jgi:hypothetical protein
MRKSITALALAAMLAPFAAGAETPGTQDANDLKQASEAKPGPCPTEIEVLPYIWIGCTVPGGMTCRMIRGRDRETRTAASRRR